ncbi:MAG: hypothetical protein IJQ59_05070 [Bacteroidaceae bacterium]|nr:hypothetical protein [Bacteroidaceae bacterium]
MLVKDFIKALQELPQEADINFQVGASEETRNTMAKTQLMNGRALNVLEVDSIEFFQSFDGGEAENTGFVDVTLTDSNYSWKEREIAEKEFDEQVNTLTR